MQATGDGFVGAALHVFATLLVSGKPGTKWQ
jgi:hypothetical protein